MQSKNRGLSFNKTPVSVMRDIRCLMQRETGGRCQVPSDSGYAMRDARCQLILMGNFPMTRIPYRESRITAAINEI